ncbi:transmembrane protein 14C-like protein [Meredithblackwellia eburnea MCA 4105]
MSTATEIDLMLGYTTSALIALGGLIGFIKASSVPSLVAGVGSASVMAFGVRRVGRNPKDVYVVVGISLLLLVVMGRRYMRSGKVMPAGIVTMLSLLSLIRFGGRLL